MWWASMIRSMSFFGSAFRAPDGVVVVQAPGGVAEDRWLPVFM